MTCDEWIQFARDEPRVLGMIVTGSRGRGALVHDASDWDLRVVVRDGEEPFADSLDTPHGSDVEVSAATLTALRTSPQWDRYSYAHAQVPVDKLDGQVRRLVDARGTLGEAEAHELARQSLSAYTNSLYRSLRDAELGLGTAARLDAADAVAALLTALFAFEQRVRPFNKYLRWELETFPLREWDANELLGLVDAALGGGEDAQRALLRAVEPHVRAAGFGDLIDEWEPHVAFLRGSE
jgi:hypothetical protein